MCEPVKTVQSNAGKTDNRTMPANDDLNPCYDFISFIMASISIKYHKIGHSVVKNGVVEFHKGLNTSS